MNILDGVTSTAAELNAVDGITAVVGDLNVLSRSAATHGDILYYGASGVPTRLGFGTAGKALITGGTGANPSWSSVATGTLTAGNVLTKDPWVVQSLTQQAHGLGEEPTFLKSVLECKSGSGGDIGYDEGDRIDLSNIVINDDSNADRGIQCSYDATNVYLRLSSNEIYIPHADSPYAPSGLTVAKWIIYVTPYRLN